jgi:hypothetical protein
LSFARANRRGANVSDVKADPGGGANTTSEHFAPVGDDSHPLPGDYVATTRAVGSGRETAVGYLDPANESKAAPGEKRTYARDPGSGATVAEVWIKNTGETIITNANGSVQLLADGGAIVTTPASTFTCSADGSIAGANGGGAYELTAGGNFVVNGLIIDTAGNLTSTGTIEADTLSGTTSVLAAGKELVDHTHPFDVTITTGANS